LFPAAYADQLVYVGETPAGGIASYKGANYSDALWDYVYNIDGWQYGPTHTVQWGIQVLVPISQSQIWSPPGWTGTYYASVPDTFQYLTHLIGKQAVIWSITDTPTTATGFHFQSGAPPVKLTYDLASGNKNLGTGLEYSASPEPGTLALGSLVMLGIAFARRRRNHDETCRH